MAPPRRRGRRSQGSPPARRRDQGGGDQRPSRARALGLAAGVCALFVAVALWIAAPAMPGEFLSDDHFYIVHNAYVQELSPENVWAILEPWGAPASHTLNYAPVHLLVHALEWHFFGGEDLRGWRAVNAAGHGLAAALLVLLLLRGGVPGIAALLGGGLFLVHPANVEVVAWIFQLKTILSLALGLGALILHPRRPALAAALFALALLTKITAVAFLPAALVWDWARHRSGDGAPRWGWLAVWALAFALVAAPEMAAFQRQADPRLVLHEDPLVHGRTIVAIAMRYLAMTATGHGVSTFQEPDPAVSWLDPWWLGGVAALALLGWRTAATLRRGRPEAAFWVLAAAAFAPVSQIFPFVYPMADRYLYGILPGLIGGGLLVGREAFEALAARTGERPRLREGLAAAPWIAGIAAAALLGAFALESRARAPVFRTNLAMMKDAMRSYPEGMQAQLLRGHAAARQGEAERAARAFQRAIELGFTDLEQLLENPQLARVRGHPAFREVLLDLARRDIARWGGREDLTQAELRQLSIAYTVAGRLPAAIRSLERALEVGGPYEEPVRQELEALRRQREARGGGAGGR